MRLLETKLISNIFFMSNKRVFLIATGVFAVAAVALFFGFRIAQGNATFRGSAIEPSLRAADFMLTRTDGETFHLNDQQGRVVLLFFGYANCPDFCPTTLAEYKQIYAHLGDQAADVDFVFVTVDPDRDSPETIDQFVHAFEPSFIGLWGTAEELQPVWDAYWVGRQAQTVDESEVEYLVSHSTRIYVVDKDGNLRLTFPFGMTASDMTRDIRKLLAE